MPSQRLEIEGSALHDGGIMAVKPLVVTFGVSEIMDGGPVMSSVLRASAVGEAVVLHTAISVAGKARSPSLPSCRSDAAAHAIDIDAARRPS